MLFMLASGTLFAADVQRYRFDLRGIYFDGAPIFQSSEKEYECVFIGPITLDSHTIFIETNRNLALAFAGPKLVAKMQISSTRSSWPMLTSVMCALKFKGGILTYDILGKARILTGSFSVSRAHHLDVDPNTDGIPDPNPEAADRFYAGTVTIPSMVAKRGDHVVVIDFEKQQIIRRPHAAQPALKERPN